MYYISLHVSPRTKWSILAFNMPNVEIIDSQLPACIAIVALIELFLFPLQNNLLDLLHQKIMIQIPDLYLLLSYYFVDPVQRFLFAASCDILQCLFIICQCLR